MNNKEIFTKALKKAAKNGFGDGRMKSHLIDLALHEDHYFEARNHWRVIFDHDFAKAFWGEGFWSCSNCKLKFCEEGASCGDNRQIWQYHLQQMILEKNPLKYMERFLK